MGTGNLFAMGALAACLVSFAGAEEADSRPTPNRASSGEARTISPRPSLKPRRESFFATSSDAEPATSSQPTPAPKPTNSLPSDHARVFLRKRVPPVTPSNTLIPPTSVESPAPPTTATSQSTATATSQSQSSSTTQSNPSAQILGAQPTADYRGVAFVTTPAPVLKFERRSTPRLRGIDYDFPEQTAQGVALLSRFPNFTLSDRRIHLDGPWYDNDEANSHFLHGVTSMDSQPGYRLASSPTNMQVKLSWDKKGSMVTDGGGVYYHYAQSLDQ